MGIGHEVDRVRVEVVTAVSDIKRVSRAATRLETILLRSVWSRIDRFLAAILLFRTFTADESHGNSASRMNLRDPNDILGFGGGQWSGPHRSGDFGHGFADGMLERFRRLGPSDQVAIVDHHGGNAAYPRSPPFLFGVAHLVGVEP